MAKIINFYDRIDDKYLDEQPAYPNYEKTNIKLPCRCLIIGSSGSGKSNCALNLIKHMDCFTKIYLLCRNLDQPLYRFLIDEYQKIEKKLKKEILFYTDNVEELPDLDADIDPSENNLFLFDDMVICGNAVNNRIGNYWIRGRTKNCSFIYISQSYFDTPKIIRRNSSHIIIKQIATNRDLKNILREYSLSDTNEKQLTALYQYIQKMGKIEPFMMIDMVTANPKLKYRLNYGSSK